MNLRPDIKFSCGAKIRSIHEEEEEVSNICVGSLTIRCNPNWDAKFL